MKRRKERKKPARIVDKRLGLARYRISPRSNDSAILSNGNNRVEFARRRDRRDATGRSKGLYVPRWTEHNRGFLFILSTIPALLYNRIYTYNGPHAFLVTSTGVPLLTGSGACVIYLGEVHIHSVTLMPAFSALSSRRVFSSSSSSSSFSFFFFFFLSFFLFSFLFRCFALDDRQMIFGYKRVWRVLLSRMDFFFFLLLPMSSRR